MTMLRRPAVLWALFALQGLCALYFSADAVNDALGVPDSTSFRDSDLFEGIVAAVLFLGTAVTGFALRAALAHQRRMRDQITIASGALGDLLENYFADWGLTPSEREVAMMAIKGFSIAEMAELRNTREGTIKAQCGAVYKKAGVSGRLQLLSLFIDDLLDNGVVPDAAE